MIPCEHTFFLSVLSDYINERQSLSIPSTVDIKTLVTLSNLQQLSPIIFYQTKLPSLQPAFASASYYAINRSKLLEKIDKEFRAMNIRYLVFKGLEIAQYYRHPYHRTSGDIDLLVREADKEKAGEILNGLGFTCDMKGVDHEWCYKKSDFAIELHHRLLYNDGLNDEQCVSFTDTVWEHVNASDNYFCHLEPEFHFVFLLLHLRKHFLWAGVGIRQFLDLAVMARNGYLNWDKVEEYINTCGIEKFSSICFSLVNRWFGVSIPLSQASLSDDFYQQAITTILSGSAFGDMSYDNIFDNHVFNDANKRGHIHSALVILFPPVSQLAAKYPIVSKYPFFLPFFWIRRAIGSLFRRSAKEGLSYAAKYMKVNKERCEELETWGLR